MAGRSISAAASSNSRKRRRVVDISASDDDNDSASKELNKRVKSCKPAAAAFLDLFSERLSPIQQILSGYLDIKDIINLTRTCKALESLYRRLVPTQWSIDKHLRRFFKNPQDFRQALSDCDALISGNFALQFFERMARPGSDLDLYVRFDYSEALCDHLVHCQGYELVEERQPLNHSAYFVTNVVVYQRKHHEAVTEVHVAISTCSPVLPVLKSFYMTAEANFLPCNKAYALFPNLTFARKRMFILNEIDDYFGKLLRKYERFGWTAERLLESLLDKNVKRPLDSSRWIGDEKSWVISLEPKLDVGDTIRESVMECSNFAVMRDGGGAWDEEESMKELILGCITFRHPMLRYEYCSYNNDWNDYVTRRLDYVGALNFIQLEEDERPNDSLTELDSFIQRDGSGIPIYGRRSCQHALVDDNFTRPPWWTYMDHMMPKFRDEFLRHGPWG